MTARLGIYLLVLAGLLFAANALLSPLLTVTGALQ